MFSQIRNKFQQVVLGTVIMGVTALSTGQTWADECYRPIRSTYKTVTTYVLREQPYKCWVTKYDDCGRPYRKAVVRYRAVRVPVIRYVKVWY